ncbi:glutathione S-transferase [Xylaria cf. heliscus]|nr:glutathione S-transferase [Xylaria cf. heliscus]
MTAQTASPDAPIAPPPNGTYSNFINPPSLHAATVAAGVTTMVSLTVLVGVRTYTKFCIMKDAKHEDYVAIFAWAGFIAWAVTYIYLFSLGFTRDVWNIRAVDLPHLQQSGAIVQYLVKEYDVENRLSYNTLKEHHLCNQWLMFQMSGQGPYFGQCTWFTYLHPERIPSAVERYANEIRRVFSVLETALTSASEVRSQWLVGDQITFTDLAFVPWNEITDMTLGIGKDQRFEGFPRVAVWHARMVNRPSWVNCMRHRAHLMSEQGLGEDGMPKDSSQKLTEYIVNPSGKGPSGNE